MDEFTCPPDHPHGRFQTCYRTHGCRCKPCRAREARRKAGERARIREGRHEGMADPTWVAGHIQALKLCGMTARDIARCSGLNEASIHRIDEGRVKRVYPQTAKAILAVRPESVAWRAEKAWVNPVGTLRRVQALMALGHSGRDISRRTGHNSEWVAKLLRSPLRVEERSRLAVVRVFEEMSMERPEGPYAERTRGIAARRGYAPPLAWDDDIDDPAAVPDVDGAKGMDEQARHDDMVRRALEGEHIERLTIRARREAVTVLNERRWSASRIAAHIGVNPKTIERDRAALSLPIYLANATHKKDGTVAA